MQFTPQQLTGGPKYAHAVRVGNWSEDLELEELKLKDYLKKKEEGSLLVNARQAQLEESLQAVELSETADHGCLCFGDRVMIFSHQTKGFMAANPHDEVAKSHEAFALTTGPNGNACVRNVFELVRADTNDGFDDDAIHYGQNIRCMLQPFSKIEQPCYMHSELVTALAAAKFSRHQEVSVLMKPSGETLWQLLHPDTSARLELEGEPVPAGSPVCVRHVVTGSFLASDEIPYRNLFGQEFETHCYPYMSLAKTQNLAGEKKGGVTGDTVLRQHGLPNIWTVCTKTHGMLRGEASAPPGGDFDATLDPAA